jgi:uncharacterized damage-inducible protein DinB
VSLREFYLERLKAEVPTFLRVLKAVPPDQLGYKPHERSPDTKQLLSAMAGEFKVCLDVVNTSRGEWAETKESTQEALVALFERSATGLIAAVEKMDDAAWERKAEFYWQGKLADERPAGPFLWFILFDGIHHRGQLTTYLRPMGAKVPAIYGPSGDDKGPDA